MSYRDDNAFISFLGDATRAKTEGILEEMIATGTSYFVSMQFQARRSRRCIPRNRVLAKE